jgi:succinylglutamate desuccinylase
MLTELNELPEHFLDTEAQDLHRILSGPTLIHLPGRRNEPLFVSILLHGNEITGLKAMQAVLKKYQSKSLPRSISLFIGNIEAARAGLRRLENQPDYNRVWSAEDTEHLLPEHHLMRKVVSIMGQRRVFVSIDIHNNTGLNPHYGCVNRLDDEFLHLAALFSRIVVYFTTPKSVQSNAFASLCPAVTLECGKPGGTGGVEHAASFVEAVLNLSCLPTHPVARHDLDLFHTVAVVKVPENISLGVGDPSVALNLNVDIDYYNFQELIPGTQLAVVASGCSLPLQAWNETGNDVGEQYFEIQDEVLVTRRTVMPAMLTRDVSIIRQDCLCYLMERLERKT